MMRPTPAPTVVAWLPLDQRRTDLRAKLDAVLAQGFAGRVLAFDAECTEGYATARAERLRLGRPFAPVDALIGGMALAHGATVATRNTGDFDGYGLTLVDPWQTP